MCEEVVVVVVVAQQGSWTSWKCTCLVSSHGKLIEVIKITDFLEIVHLTGQYDRIRSFNVEIF